MANQEILEIGKEKKPEVNEKPEVIGDTSLIEHNPELGGFGPEHLRRSEPIVKDFAEDEVPKREVEIIPSQKKRNADGEAINDNSPVYLVFRSGLAEGVKQVMDSPVQLESLWNELSQNAQYYQELLKRGEII